MKRENERRILITFLAFATLKEPYFTHHYRTNSRRNGHSVFDDGLLDDRGSSRFWRCSRSHRGRLHHIFKVCHLHHSTRSFQQLGRCRSSRWSWCLHAKHRRLRLQWQRWRCRFNDALNARCRQFRIRNDSLNNRCRRLHQFRFVIFDDANSAADGSSRDCHTARLEPFQRFGFIDFADWGCSFNSSNASHLWLLGDAESSGEGSAICFEGGHISHRYKVFFQLADGRLSNWLRFHRVYSFWKWKRVL